LATFLGLQGRNPLDMAQRFSETDKLRQNIAFTLYLDLQPSA